MSLFNYFSICETYCTLSGYASRNTKAAGNKVIRFLRHIYITQEMEKWDRAFKRYHQI